MQQAIIWTTVDPFHLCIYAALGGDEIIIENQRLDIYFEANKWYLGT